MDWHLAGRTLHIGAGLGGFLAGLGAALAPKFGANARWHRWIGRAYASCMIISTSLSIPLAIRMGSVVLTIIGVLTLPAVMLGWRATRRHRRRADGTSPRPTSRRVLLVQHVILMGSSYVAAWTAFLLSNPILGEGTRAHAFLYAFGPTVLGTVLIARSSRRLRLGAGRATLLFAGLLLAPPPLWAQHKTPADSALLARLSQLADSVRVAQRWPGLSLAVVSANGDLHAVASGYADTVRRVPLRTTDKLLQGSVGKTYVAAVAMQLVREGRLDIEAPIARYLDGAPLLDSIAQARRMTVRHLLSHTSGIVRYEFDPGVTARLRAEPFKTWTPEERLAVLFGKVPPFAPGEGWEYSDTNFIVLGMIIERITGRPYYTELQRRLLEPLRLTHTIPSDRRAMPGVANGYAGPRNDLGGYDASIGADGLFAVNPQFEWTGGGVASTTSDLARWAKLLYEGNAFPDSLVRLMTTGVPAKLGPNVRYGLGAIIRDTPLGVSWGHSGFFPGYATEMVYYPASRVAVAVQVNSTDPYPRGLVALMQRVAREAGARETTGR